MYFQLSDRALESLEKGQMLLGGLTVPEAYALKTVFIFFIGAPLILTISEGIFAEWAVIALWGGKPIRWGRGKVLKKIIKMDSFSTVTWILSIGLTLYLLLIDATFSSSLDGAEVFEYETKIIMKQRDSFYYDDQGVLNRFPGGIGGLSTVLLGKAVEAEAARPVSFTTESGDLFDDHPNGTLTSFREVNVLPLAYVIKEGHFALKREPSCQVADKTAVISLRHGSVKALEAGKKLAEDAKIATAPNKETCITDRDSSPCYTTVGKITYYYLKSYTNEEAPQILVIGLTTCQENCRHEEVITRTNLFPDFRQMESFQEKNKTNEIYEEDKGLWKKNKELFERLVALYSVLIPGAHCGIGMLSPTSPTNAEVISSQSTLAVIDIVRFLSALSMFFILICIRIIAFLIFRYKVGLSLGTLKIWTSCKSFADMADRIMVEKRLDIEMREKGDKRWYEKPKKTKAGFILVNKDSDMYVDVGVEDSTNNK